MQCVIVVVGNVMMRRWIVCILICLVSVAGFSENALQVESRSSVRSISGLLDVYEGEARFLLPIIPPGNCHIAGQKVSRQEFRRHCEIFNPARIVGVYTLMNSEAAEILAELENLERPQAESLSLAFPEPMAMMMV